MRTIKFTQAKGGQGTTTVAVAYAARLAAEGHTATVAGHDPDSLAAVTGQGPWAQGTREVAPNLFVGDPGAGAYDTAVLVLDGTDLPADVTYLVTRNCYLALRAAMRLNLDQVAGVVLLEEPGRSLTDWDVADVLGRTVVARIEASPAVARAVDAGTLVCRTRARESLEPLGLIDGHARGYAAP